MVYVWFNLTPREVCPKNLLKLYRECNWNEKKRRQGVWHENRMCRERFHRVCSHDDSSSECVPLIGWHFCIISLLAFAFFIHNALPIWTKLPRKIICQQAHIKQLNESTLLLHLISLTIDPFVLSALCKIVDSDIISNEIFIKTLNQA